MTRTLPQPLRIFTRETEWSCFGDISVRKGDASFSSVMLLGDCRSSSSSGILLLWPFTSDDLAGGGDVSLEMRTGGKKAKGKVKVNGAHLLKLL